MYSEKELPKKIYQGIIIAADGKTFNYYSLTNLNKEMLVGPIVRYAELKKNNFIDDPIRSSIEKRFKNHLSVKNYEYCVAHLTNNIKDTAAFQQWFKNYIELSSKKKAKRIEVYTGNYFYNNESILKLKDSLLLFKL